MAKVTTEVLGLVYKYAEWMVELLRVPENQRKVPWTSEDVSMQYLVGKLEKKVKELKELVEPEARRRLVNDAWHKAADIGNYAWMIADKSEKEIAVVRG